MSGPRAITDDDIAALQSVQDGELAVTIRPYVEYATVDTMRNFARAYGDDNPLFGDEAYGRAGPYGTVVAPPLFPIASGTARPPADDVGPVVRGALRGTTVEVENDRWTLHRWIEPGTRLDRRDTHAAVEPEISGSATTVLVTTRSTYSVHGEVLAVHDRVHRHGGRSIADAHDADRRDYTGAHRYDETTLADIERTITGWTRRGATPWDVRTITPGSRIGPFVKGPMTTTDLVAYRGGVGPGPFGVEPLALAHPNRRVRPDFYDRDPSGAWDARERLHWDDDYARRCGHPGAYDYSHTRLNWMVHLLTDWMGDHARLEQVEFTHLAHNYRGDTHWIEGTVDHIELPVTGEPARVVVALTGTNQLGTVTCRGAAAIRL